MQIKSDPKHGFVALNLMHVAERQYYHLIDIYGSLTKSWKFQIFAGGFLVTIIFGTGQSGPDFSEMNNDADLIFIAVWQQMMGFSNMANLIVRVDHTAT